ncbi:MAG: bifunctional metallophosphatase/5'-nucleotidase [Deltaproteobacteria bacterium]|nr:MAG: bifunctional metallophosphatase/5'-nucleotidase [Deltaproteobacteria bacterium]
MKSITFLLLLSFSFQIQAKLVQFLHTNDLHGFFEHSVEDKHRGGYAALKAEIDKQKKRAMDRGIPSLVVDAGDFMEGSIFYFSQNGRKTFDIMNKMGYDAVAVGNHDWLMGSKELAAIVKDVPPKFAYLGANFKPNFALFPNLRKSIEDYKVFTIDGVRIALMGLTTDELFYKWRLDFGDIHDPVKTGKKLATEIKKDDKADFVVALTHNGFLTDKDLVKESRDLDLVIGGHSHTYLFKPYYQKNKNKKEIPIVQAGEHAKVLGRLVVNVEKGKPLEVIEYELIPISEYKDVDHEIQDYVKEARSDIESKFGKNWLQEEIGISKIPLTNNDERLTTWTAFITDGIKECMGGSQMAAHSPGFGGADIPEGGIDREMIFQTYPRVFDFKDKYGWHVYQVESMGVFLKVIIKFILRQQYPVAFSGVTFDLVDSNGDVIDVEPGDIVDDGVVTNEKTWLGIDTKFKVKNLKIGGKKVKWFKKYKIAIPEGIVRGGYGISRFVKFIMRNSAKGESSIWGCLNEKVKKEEVIDSEYARRRRKFVGHDKTKSGMEYNKYEDYMFVPAKLSPKAKLKNIPGYTEKDLPFKK